MKKSLSFNKIITYIAQKVKRPTTPLILHSEANFNKYI